MSLTTDLACSYSMEEVTGAARLDAWAGYNLAQHGGVAQVAGKLNFGAGFTAASSQYLSHVSVPEVYSLNFYKGGFTIAFWVYVTAFGTYPLASVAGEWVVSMDGGGNAIFTVYGDVFGASGTATSTSACTLNAWNLIVCQFKYVINGSATFLAMNNTLSSQVNSTTPGTGTMTANSSTAQTSGEFNVGRDNFSFGGSFFNGRIDQLVIWQRPLTSVEATLLFSNTFFPFAPAVLLSRSWSWCG